MQKKIQQFVFLSERLLYEAGELRLRRTWSELRSVSIELAPYMKQLSTNFDPKYALLFLLSCDNESTQKNGCFSMLFRKILSQIPNRAMFSLLSSVSRVELNNYLLPFLYEKGDLGSIAVYSAAKLGLKIKFDAFEFFLNSREWTQTDLINLSFLVLLDEKKVLATNIEKIYKNTEKESFGQFLNILNNIRMAEPVMPDIQQTEAEIHQNSQQLTENGNNTQNQQPKYNENAGSKNIFRATNQPESSQIQAPLNSHKSTSSTSRAVSTSKKLPVVSTGSKSGAVDFLDNIKKLFQEKSGIPDRSLKKRYVVLGVLILVLIVLFYVISSLSAAVSNEADAVKPPPKNIDIPEFYLDAVTNQKLTPRYIQADVDYRMGELYMSRNLYSEAVSFFRDAVKTEPNHLIAKMRWGVAESIQGNHPVAGNLFKEVYSSDPKIRNLNLYIARNYATEKDFANAKKHYKEEYEYHGQLEVAMEYANYLARIGERNSAMDMIARLQEKFPGEMLVLEASPDEDKSAVIKK